MYNFLSPTVITHSFNGTKGEKGVNIHGAFDINVWYSHETDTKTAVMSKRYNYSDVLNVPLKMESNMTDDSEIIVRCLKQPTVSNVEIKNGVVYLSIEKEMGVEIVGDMKVRINVEEDEDEYVEIYDEVADEVLENIDENYLDEDSVNQN
ncbi:MAG: outer spore coat protein CotE [Firmicutes bacterium]|nr:outer spore coat protein CotE [Bacillota bacterium]